MKPLKKTKQTASDLKGRTFDLCGLVEAQAGSVVSRELIRKPGGTVTVFAFDAGGSLSEHTAPFDALALGLDGTAEVTIAGAAHSLKKGETIIMPAEVPHALRALSQFKMLLIMIKK
jgi:quercetin dioxygenase-like cupin family protein